METPIKITFSYSVEDYIRAVPFAQQNTFLHKHWMAIFPIGVFLGMIRLTRAMSYESDQTNWLAVIIIAAIPALVVFFVIFFLTKNSSQLSQIDKISPLITKHHISKQFAAKSYLSKEVTFIFSNTGIELSNDSTSDDIDWKSLRKVIESETDMFFYTPDDNSIFIPKHAFINKEQENQVRELAKEKLGDKAKF